LEIDLLHLLVLISFFQFFKKLLKISKYNQICLDISTNNIHRYNISANCGWLVQKQNMTLKINVCVILRTKVMLNK